MLQVPPDEEHLIHVKIFYPDEEQIMCEVQFDIGATNQLYPMMLHFLIPK